MTVQPGTAGGEARKSMSRLKCPGGLAHASPPLFLALFMGLLILQVYSFGLRSVSGQERRPSSRGNSFDDSYFAQPEHEIGDLLHQSADVVYRKSAGCVSCHQNVPNI